MRGYRIFTIGRVQSFISIDTVSCNRWDAFIFKEESPKEMGICLQMGAVGFVLGLVSKEYIDWKNNQ